MESVSRNEPDKAIDQLKRAVDLHPNFGLALNELGVQYLRKGELDKAEEVLRKGITTRRLTRPSPALIMESCCCRRRSLPKLRRSFATL